MVSEQIKRFAAALAGIYLVSACGLVGLRIVFALFHWDLLVKAGFPLVMEALLKGLRFDAAAGACLLCPIPLLLLGSGVWEDKWLRRVFIGYLAFAAFVAALIGACDLQYFKESGKHLTYEATAYLNGNGVPVFQGAFELNPWLSWISLFLCIGVALGFGHFGRKVQRVAVAAPSSGTRHHMANVLVVVLWLGLSAIALRGGLQGRPLQIGHANISSNPYVNALCLNPVYSVLRSTISGGKAECRFYTESSNIDVTRELLLQPGTAELRNDFPLLRASAGTPEGNRKNVVIFILESWTGKDVGIMGGPPGVTPFFDQLAKQGAFFDHFYAMGIRSAEGIFSVLCSFPNQPVQPILNRSISFGVRWRALSDILADAAYQTIFVHGRDLNFDQMKFFLKTIQFHQIIDRYDFPPNTPRENGAWPGYDDEEVMRRANQEFARQTQPFLGVIYTMNTHPPFMTPEKFPHPFQPADTPVNRFLNSLHYSDDTLRMFFENARQQNYFKDTIFILVADHARTRDSFDFDSQHRIPFLIYSPEFVEPQVRHTVGGQLDIVPTVLGLLNLKTVHSSWGQDLLHEPEERGFAVSIVGNDARWHDSQYLLNDSLGKEAPLLFDLTRDPQCQSNLWTVEPEAGERIRKQLRSYVSLSQRLLFEDRVYPRFPVKDGAGR